MATWLIHFRIADEILDRLDRNSLDPAAFIMGNVAPDCGIPDADGINYTPPRKVSHFGKSGQREYSRFFNDYFSAAKDSVSRSFFLGYYLHLLTDDAWVEKIYRPISDRFGGEFPDFTDFTHHMRAEWAELDLRYLAENPPLSAYEIFCSVREFPNRYLAFFPDEAFTLQLSRIREYYSALPTGEVPQYTNAKMLDDFVRSTSAALLPQLEQVQKQETFSCI